MTSVSPESGHLNMLPAPGPLRFSPRSKAHDTCQIYFPSSDAQMPYL